MGRLTERWVVGRALPDEIESPEFTPRPPQKKYTGLTKYFTVSPDDRLPNSLSEWARTEYNGITAKTDWMAVNLDKPQNWKADIAQSVDLYNPWFLNFALQTNRDERVKATQDVEPMLHRTENLKNIRPEELSNHPEILFALRMSTAPPDCS